jgi:hypothetical protein
MKFESRIARLEQQTAKTTETGPLVYVFCDRSELPDPLDDAAINPKVTNETHDYRRPGA